MPAAAFAIHGATVVTMDPLRTVAKCDLLLDSQGRIEALVAEGEMAEAERTLDATGLHVVPGLVNAHTHLCHVLLRGMAEERPLPRWLRESVWPLELAHDAESMRTSARLGLAELLLGGTTSVLDLGSASYTDVLFEAADEAGMRYTGGRAIADLGDDVPLGLREDTALALRAADQLAARWHGTRDGLARYAYYPRSTMLCSADLLRSVAARADAEGFVVATHASEQRSDVEALRARTGRTPIQLLAECGLTGPLVGVAHCVWPESSELDTLAQGGASVVHCPSSNMKLGAGTAPVAAYLDCGVNLGLGTDAPAAGTALDTWEEMRLAGFLAKLRNGPEALPAAALYEMATLGGARALGLEAEIGSIEIGKSADLAILDLRGVRAAGGGDIYSRLVYAARASDVRHVLVRGQAVVEDGRLLTLDTSSIVAEADRRRGELAHRAAAGMPGAESRFPDSSAA